MMNISNKKRWSFTWYNYLAQEETSDIVYADTLEEAIIVAVAVMKLYAGDHYDESSIEDIYEITDDVGHTLDSIKERYIKLGKADKWIFDDYELDPEKCRFLEDDDEETN